MYQFIKQLPLPEFSPEVENYFQNPPSGGFVNDQLLRKAVQETAAHYLHLTPDVHGHGGAYSFIVEQLSAKYPHLNTGDTDVWVSSNLSAC